MNYAHIVLAFLGAAVAYFGAGFALFAALPGMKAEYLKYPAVYRSNESLMKVMPYNLVAILVSLLIVAVLYAKIYPGGGGVRGGLWVGALMGLFAVCTFVVHEYVFVKIGPALAMYQGVTYLLQWLIAGAMVGLIYKP